MSDAGGQEGKGLKNTPEKGGAPGRQRRGLPGGKRPERKRSAEGQERGPERGAPPGVGLSWSGGGLRGLEVRAGVGRWQAGPGPGDEGRGSCGEGHTRTRGSAAEPDRRSPRGRAPLTVSEFRSLPGASAVREDIFSGSRGTGRPGGGGGGPGVPSLPLPPRWPGDASSKAGRRGHPGSRRGRGGQGGEGKGTPRVLVAPCSGGPGRHGGGGQAGGRGPGRGRGAGPGGGGGRRWRGRGGRDVRGRGGQGGAAETPPPAAGP